MKQFRLEFSASHSTEYNKNVVMFAEAKSLEKVLPRVKRILKDLAKLPNPLEHGKWIVRSIKEVEK